MNISKYLDLPVDHRTLEVYGTGKQCHRYATIEEAIAHALNCYDDLLFTHTMGVSMNTPDFLDWMADRLVNVYGESPNVDFVQSLRDRAKMARYAMSKALGGKL